jgi:hypothetical protein
MKPGKRIGWENLLLVRAFDEDDRSYLPKAMETARNLPCPFQADLEQEKAKYHHRDTYGFGQNSIEAKSNTTGRIIPAFYQFV